MKLSPIRERALVEGAAYGVMTSILLNLLREFGRSGVRLNFITKSRRDEVIPFMNGLCQKVIEKTMAHQDHFKEDSVYDHILLDALRSYYQNKPSDIKTIDRHQVTAKSSLRDIDAFEARQNAVVEATKAKEIRKQNAFGVF